jgi:NtrC-family two-component system sensor histidine kinase KinB
MGALGLFASRPAQYSVADLHFLAIVTPVVETTARKLMLIDDVGRAEQDLRRMEMLRRELLDQLASEMRSPLTVLHNGLDFLGSALLPPGANEAQEQVDEMRLVAGTTLDMVENLLELSKIDDGALELTPATVSLDGLLRERSQARSQSAKIADVHLRVRCDPPDAAITTDGQLFRRVLDTLVVNALRHTPRRGEVALVGLSRPQLVTIAVADTGAPIPPTDRELLLERGPWPGERAPTRAFGLGFARAAVDYLGGRLTIEAPAGAGNLFRIALPQ